MIKEERVTNHMTQDMEHKNLRYLRVEMFGTV